MQASEPLPLNLKIQKSKDVGIDEATAFLDTFLHKGVAIHAANNTISAQLHRLYVGLKDEKKRTHRRNSILSDSQEN